MFLWHLLALHLMFCSISSTSSPWCQTASVQLLHWLVLVLIWAQLTCPAVSYA